MIHKTITGKSFSTFTLFSEQVDVYACGALRWASMGRMCLRRWASGSAVVFLHTLALSWTGEAHGLHHLVPFALQKFNKIVPFDDKTVHSRS